MRNPSLISDNNIMTVGESAGVAAAQALDENVAVQDINMAKYLKKLNTLGQRLDWEKVKQTEIIDDNTIGGEG